MLYQIVEFLNLEVFKHHGLKGVVLDFVKDKQNNLYLLDCKEHIDYQMIPVDLRYQKEKELLKNPELWSSLKDLHHASTVTN
mmetsp:Transcript_15284/g.15267  ORF Transcript_15284/g.15267 Transcript_15284/m.15267 type:complete len:82 (+) Transcript_15284:438-683(+)